MVLTELNPGVVHPDTQAVLLLCGAFTKEGGQETKPLTLTEYNAIAAWLRGQGRRPADLLRAPEEPFPPGETGLPQVERVRALLGRGFQMAAAVERWQRLGLWVISRGEERYPERLRRNLRSVAPALLYGAGDVARLALGGLAVVGSRETDDEGLAFTRRIAERCAGEGVQVVSGGARGVDQAVVAAGLGAGGGAVAVLADRLDRAATSREAKEPLRSGRLTLVTPYEPESGFTVGKAMGRNKHIYGLADRALVVRFAVGEGGTWAGALEQLSRNKPGSVFVPLFVRAAHNPEDGLRELLSKGAQPFPEDDFQGGNLADVLRCARVPPVPEAVEPASVIAPVAQESNTPVTPELPVPPEPVSPALQEPAPSVATSVVEAFTPTSAEGDTCYRRCLPLLLQCLREEPGKKELPGIARQLEVLLTQLNKWLERAIEEGRVKTLKKKRRIVYVNALINEPPSLFDRGGDAA